MLASGSVQEAHDLALHRPRRDPRGPGAVPPLLRRVPHLPRGGEDRGAHRRRPAGDDRRRPGPRPSRARADPRPPVLRGTAQNPDVFFQAREACNPFYDACAGHRAGGDGPVRRDSPGRQYHLFDYVGAPGRRAGRRHDGLRRRGRPRDRRAPGRARARRSACVKVRLYRPFSVEHFVGALPKTVTRPSRCSTAPRSPAPRASRSTRTWSPPWARPGARGTRRSRGRRRALRPLLQGVHPGHGQGGLRRAREDEAEEPLHRRHRRRRDPHEPRRTTPTSTSSPRSVVRACSSASAPTARWAPTRTRSRSSARRPTTTPRATSSTTPRRPAPSPISHLRFGPKRIRSSYLITQGQLRRLPPVHLPREVRHARATQRRAPSSCSTPPTGRTRSGTTCRARSRSRSSGKKLKFYVIDAYEVAKNTGMGGRINTIMQTCFFAISGVLPREEAIAEDQGRDQEDLRPQGRGRRPARTSRRWTRRWRTCTRSRCPAKATARGHAARRSSPRPPRSSSSDVTGAMMAGKGDDLPVSAMPVDGTLPTGTTQWEKRNIALEIPVWDPEVCIQCGKCSFVCPHAADPREGLRPEAAREGARRPSSRADAKGKDVEGLKFTIQVAPEDCTGCGVCVDDLPGQGQGQPEAQGHQHGSRSCRCASRSARTGSSSSSLPEAGPRPASRPTCKGSQFLRAALRVLRRLRRLRRDALRQAADPALRRPDADRQRHRLLVDLRRQPAHHALHDQRRRPRPDLVQLAVRGQRRVRLRHPPGGRQAAGAGRASC